MNREFELFHPLVNFYYFFIVIMFSMFFMHPIFLIISLISSIIYSIMLNGKSAVKFNILYMTPLLIVTAIINPMFNHGGITIIGYFNTGNPITLESIVYGICAAAMFISVILWFSCYNAIMSSDKFIYLFGRITPSLSLIFSMVLRFVPRYKAQIKVISNAQRCIGQDIRSGNIIQRAKNGMKIFSIMMNWALENSIETADSMKARGYGLKGRSSFSNYIFEKRDKYVLGIMMVLTFSVILGAIILVVSSMFYQWMKAKNGGHAHFPFEKVVLPVLALALLSWYFNTYPVGRDLPVTDTLSATGLYEFSK